ncbi:hypothetical protein KAR91_67600 [Candidatus Pacearchaeota archaeon]|nr:hypothetical protein [Candidatus Pacearchaeota archaeon]
MRGRVHIGYIKHKQKKTKRLIKQGPRSVMMEVDNFDQSTGEKISSRFVRVRIDEAIRTRDHLVQQVDDINELILDVEALLAD